LNKITKIILSFTGIGFALALDYQTNFEHSRRIDDQNSGWWNQTSKWKGRTFSICFDGGNWTAFCSFQRFFSKIWGEKFTIFKELDPGSVVLCMHQPFNKQICAWIGANSVSAFVSREERFHLLSILGEDVQKFRRNADTTRQV
jgi:hypothetical protein